MNLKKKPRDKIRAVFCAVDDIETASKLYFRIPEAITL